MLMAPKSKEMSLCAEVPRFPAYIRRLLLHTASVFKDVSSHLEDVKVRPLQTQHFRQHRSLRSQKSAERHHRKDERPSIPGSNQAFHAIAARSRSSRNQQDTLQSEADVDRPHSFDIPDYEPDPSLRHCLLGHFRSPVLAAYDACQ